PPRSETPVPGDRETGLRAGARGPPRNRAPVAQVVLRRSAPARPLVPRERPRRPPSRGRGERSGRSEWAHRGARLRRREYRPARAAAPGPCRPSHTPAAAAPLTLTLLGVGGRGAWGRRPRTPRSTAARAATSGRAKTAASGARRRQRRAPA